MDKTKTREIIFRILSVVIALIAWMYVNNFENPEKTVEIPNISVKLTNVNSLTQSGFVMIKSVNGVTTKITIKGRSSDVLAVKPQDFVIEANLGSGTRIKGSNSVPIDIKEKPSNIEITSKPLYIDVELDELVEKNFPVNVQIEGQAREGYSYISSVVKPAEVVLKGASRYMGSVNSVVTKVDIKDAISDIQTSLPLQAVDKSGKPIYGQVLDSSGKPIYEDVIDITPRTVDVTIPIQRAKEVNVIVKTTGKSPAGVFIKETTASPAKVVLIGSDAIINSINSIDTMPVGLEAVTGSTVKSAKLVIPQGVSIANNIQNVNVNILVENTVNRIFTIPVSFINVPDGLKADLLTNTINVTLSGRESLINSVNPSDVTAVVDLSTVPIEDNEYDFTPKIDYPRSQGFEQKDISPQKIRIRITKKQG